MTIEFLRARLLSERSISKTARQRADELAKRVSYVTVVRFICVVMLQIWVCILCYLKGFHIWVFLWPLSFHYAFILFTNFILISSLSSCSLSIYGNSFQSLLPFLSVSLVFCLQSVQLQLGHLDFLTLNIFEFIYLLSSLSSQWHGKQLNL